MSEPNNAQHKRLSEKNIFLRLKKYKDKQAFMQAYDQYVDQIYRFVYFKLGNKEEAEDITSQVFVKCWSYVRDGKLRSQDNYKSLRSFLYTIARNAVIDHYRTRKETVEVPETLPAEPESRDGQLEELKAAFRRMIYSLPEPYREALVLTDRESTV